LTHEPSDPPLTVVRHVLPWTCFASAGTPRDTGLPLSSTCPLPKQSQTGVTSYSGFLSLERASMTNAWLLVKIYFKPRDTQSSTHGQVFLPNRVWRPTKGPRANQVVPQREEHDVYRAEGRYKTVKSHHSLSVTTISVINPPKGDYKYTTSDTKSRFTPQSPFPSPKPRSPEGAFTF